MMSKIKLFLEKLDIRKFLPYILVFGFVLTLSYLVLDLSKGASTFFDTTSYQEVAGLLCGWQMPNIGFRTIGYPLLVALAGGCKSYDLLIHFQIFLTAFSAVLLLWILINITQKKVASIAIALLVFSDIPEVIGYSQTVLSETLSMFLLLFSIAVHIKLYKEGNWVTLGLCLVSDILLILAKPALFLLPVAFYIALIFYRFITNPKDALGRTLALKVFALLILNIALIGVWSTVNYKQNNYFGMSSVSEVNTLGKMIEYKYLEDTSEYQNPPEILEEISAASQKKINYSDPWRVLADLNGIKLEPAGLSQIYVSTRYPLSKIREVNNYLIDTNKEDYYQKSFDKVKIVFETKRENYNLFINKDSEKNIYLNSVSYVFDSLLRHRLNILFAILAFALLVFFRNKELSFKLLIILGAIFYLALGIAFFSYSEESRLRMPVTPLINGLVILALYSIFAQASKLLKKIIG